MSILFDVAYTYLRNSVLQFLSGRSRWPCGLKRGSAAARLLGLRVRMPLGAGVTVCGESFMCYQVEVSATGRSLVQRSPTECVCH